VPFGNVTSREPIGSTFSPDGRWIADASSPNTGGGLVPNRGVFVQPFPATGQITQAQKHGIDFHPVWSRDGKESIWVPSAASGQMVVAAVTSRSRIEFGNVTTVPQRVTADRPSGNFRAYDILPDGRFIGLVYSTDSTTSRVRASDLRVVLNWFQEHDAKVLQSQ
jgi:Tol biopolymer transport system component